MTRPHDERPRVCLDLCYPFRVPQLTECSFSISAALAWASKLLSPARMTPASCVAQLLVLLNKVCGRTFQTYGSEFIFPQVSLRLGTELPPRLVPTVHGPNLRLSFTLLVLGPQPELSGILVDDHCSIFLVDSPRCKQMTVVSFGRAIRHLPPHSSDQKLSSRAPCHISRRMQLHSSKREITVQHLQAFRFVFI